MSDPTQAPSPLKANERMPSSLTFKQLALICAALAFITFIVYWPVLSHDFVDYDDGDYVVSNPHVQAGLTWAGVKWAFQSGHASNWHPLTWVSHMLDISLFGQAPGLHHLTSLVLHCANSALVFLVLWQFTRLQWPSLAVAALFALHPMHVESVAWVSERKDVLSAFFGLLSLWAYARYGQSRGESGAADQISKSNRSAVIFYSLTLVFFVLALMSKPMLVTLPFLLVLLDWWPLQRLRFDLSTSKAKWLLLEKLPFFALAATSSYVTFLVQQKGGAVSVALPFRDRMDNALVSYLRYLGNTFWPDGLSVLYPHPGHWPLNAVIAAAIALTLLTMAAVLCIKKLPFITVGWLWFVGMLVPVIGLVQVGIQSMADRYVYLPHIGLFIAIVWSLYGLLQRFPKLLPPIGIVGGLIVVACIGVTRSQVGIWQNTETLFRRAVEVTKENYLAYNNLGFYYSKQERHEEAKTNFEVSLRINPHYEDAHNNLGRALEREGRFAEAIEHYRAALRTAPNQLEVHNNLGKALSEVGQMDEAIAHFRFVLERKLGHVNAHNNLGIVFAMRNQLDEAIAEFNTALKYNPRDSSAYGNLGNAYAVKKDFAKASEYFAEALRLAPKDDQTYNNLATSLVNQNKLEEASTNFLKAVELNPANAGARVGAGYVLARLGRREEAVKQLQAALQLQPNSEQAKRLLDELYRPANP